jgi:uncharacterized protein YhfF
MFQEEQARTMGSDFKAITAERRELRESGLFHEAKILVLRELYYAKKEDTPTAIFKRKLLTLVLQGAKVQTRRVSKRMWKVGRAYAIRDRWFTKPQAHIVITRRFKQRLGDISQEDARKEGFSSREEFKETWTEIYAQWLPDKVVTVYEFKLQQGSGRALSVP